MRTCAALKSNHTKSISGIFGRKTMVCWTASSTVPELRAKVCCDIFSTGGEAFYHLPVIQAMWSVILVFLSTLIKHLRNMGTLLFNSLKASSNIYIIHSAISTLSPGKLFIAICPKLWIQCMPLIYRRGQPPSDTTLSPIQTAGGSFIFHLSYFVMIIWAQCQSFVL